MPQGYFDELQREMVRHGFTLISRLSIDNTECEYHVPALLARETSLFFHVRGKSVIFKLSYHESQCRIGGEPDEDVRGYWKVSVYIRFLPYRILLEQNYDRWHGKSMDELDGGLYHDMPILGSTKIELKGFRHSSGHGALERDSENEQVVISFEEDYPTEKLYVGELASRLRHAYLQLQKYLDKEPLRRLQLTSFVPFYTFSGWHGSPFEAEKLEQLFWSKFDWRYFRHLVDHPWGYSYRSKKHRAVLVE